MTSASASASASTSASAPQAGGQGLILALAWLAVGLPLAWGVLETLRKTLVLFQ